MSVLRRALLRVPSIAFGNRPGLISGVVLAATVAALGSGCAEKDKSEIVVAEIGPREITLDYFERKMNTMSPEYVPADIQSQSGREALLETMVRKEVMALKAEELGMDADGKADESAGTVAQLKSVTRMREDVVAPAQNPSEEEVYDYYEKLPRKLSVSYLLFDDEAQAEEARGLVAGGELWRTVAERFDAGDPGPSGDWTLEMKYGTVADDLEQVVFDLPVGGISDPIDSIYGWFVIRVNDVTYERVAPLDSIRDKVVASVVKQNTQFLISDFIEQVFEEYDMTIDEEVLRLVFDAIPEDVPMQPMPKMEDLESLQVEPRDLDRVLMSYGDQEWTVRRYADFYDRSNYIGRPKRANRLGGLRRMLKEMAVRELMPVAAKDKGYLEDPVVQDEYKLRREQAMVTRLHTELIAKDVEVTPGDVDAYWAENSEEWHVPERREVFGVVCATEADALSAQLELQGGASFKDINERYGVEGEVKARNGNIGQLREDNPTPFTEHAFRLAQEGDLSLPVEIGADRWLVLQLNRIFPEESPELADVRVQVGRRVQQIKEDELFEQRVEEWSQEYDIKTYPEHLMKAVYDPSPPDNTIPVNVGGGAL